MADEAEVQPGMSPEEIDLSNKLIEACQGQSYEVTDPMVASAAAALLAGSICGMLGLGGEDTSPEEYNEAAGYLHTRIEEFALSLIAEITNHGVN